MKIIFLFSIILLLIETYIKCELCGRNDVDAQLSKCNEQNKRNIQFALRNNCSLPDNSTLQLNDVDCDFTCGHGEFLTYDFFSKKYLCNLCPENTFSFGGDRRICGEKREWIEENLVDFQNVCYTAEKEEDLNFVLGEKEFSNLNTHNCRNWQINGNNKNITTGGTDLANVFYVALLQHSVKVKNKGMIMFGYTKKTVNDSQLDSNGQFKFFINGKEMVHDKTDDQEAFNDKMFNLQPGTYTFSWFYYYQSGSDPTKSLKDHRMDLKYIEIFGIDDAAYECTSCNANGKVGFSKAGWDHCEVCPSLQYYDSVTNKCIECSKEKFSYPNSYGEEACILRPPCDTYDYKEIHSECVDNKITVTYDWNQPMFCNKDHPDSFKLPDKREEPCPDKCDPGYFKDLNSDKKKRCVPCLEGEFSNIDTDPFACETCSKEQLAPRVFNITEFHNILSHRDHVFCDNQCESEFFAGLCDIFNYSGWKFTHHGVIPGNNIPEGVTFTLSKNIKIIHENIGFVQISYRIINLSNAEFFSIELDDHLIENVDTSPGNHKVKIDLSKGDHVLKIKYQKKRSSVNNLHNPLMITNFLLYASDEGGAITCEDFKEGKNNLNGNLGNPSSNGALNDNNETTPEKSNITNLNKDNTTKKSDSTNTSGNASVTDNIPGKGENQVTTKKDNSTETNKENIPEKSDKSDKDTSSEKQSESKLENSISSHDKNNDTTKKQDKFDAISENNPNPVINSKDCPDFTLFDPKSNSCKLLEIIHNKPYLVKYMIGKLKSKHNQICDINSELCYNNNKFIGPIRESNGHKNLFYISYQEKDEIKIEDFTYKKQSESIKEGHIFGLFYHKSENLTFSNEENNLVMFNYDHSKLLKNLGSKISNVVLIPSQPYIQEVTPGLMVNYTEGDICQQDANGIKRYSSIVFFSCDKSDLPKNPKLVTKINDNCTYVFVWESRYGCPQCLKKDLLKVEEGCIGDKKLSFYRENTNCIIEAASSNSSGFNFSANNMNSTLTYDLFKKEEALYSSYFLKDIKTPIKDWKSLFKISFLNHENNKSNADSEYVSIGKEEEKCSVNESEFSLSMLIVIFVPIFYLLTTLCFVVFYCKYRRLTNDYQRLRQEVDVNTNKSVNMADLSMNNDDYLDLEDK